MAKRYNGGLNLKHYFIALGSIFSVLALFVFISASQKSTNTQSDASGGCIMKPKLKYVSSVSHPDSVEYILRVWNDSALNCDKILHWVSSTESPDQWYMFYLNHIPDGSFQESIAFDDLVPQQKQTLRLIVGSLDYVRNGTYYLPVKVCRAKPDCSNNKCDDHDLEKLYSYWYGVTDNCTTIKLKYVKD